jgi:hypothetical protein
MEVTLSVALRRVTQAADERDRRTRAKNDALATGAAVQLELLAHLAQVAELALEIADCGLATATGDAATAAFLTVGAAKEWILQYCLPLGEDQTASQVSTSVVRIGSSSALAAPYPKLTFRPPLYHRAGTHLMLHGFVSPAGKFQELRLLGRGDPRATAAVIAVLDKWEFRPATQDGRPVRVERLLAIPGE